MVSSRSLRAKLLCGFSCVLTIAAAKQAVLGGVISRSVSAITEMAARTTGAAGESAVAAGKLASRADQFRRSLGGFRMP